ncbi:MAG: transglycosylase SLT domain-containing protein [Treponema sp.]|nr:transglycosylase SLT domain-containing protein [Treponema sp.]
MSFFMFFKKKSVFFALGMTSLVSCMSLHAESGMIDPELLITLPVPELSIELLSELSTGLFEEQFFEESGEEPQSLSMEPAVMVEEIPLIEEELMYPELNLDAPIGLPSLPPSRPMRITPYNQPVHLTSEMRIQPLSIREGSILGLEQELTQEYIIRYSSPKGIETLEAIMRRGSLYFAFIRKEVEARKLPLELMYLPVIESGFLPTAVSKSGATGLWQFMKNSIAPYDMRVNEWMDERMDFWKSTMGALSKLEENYQQLGDWSLALAAYNSGLGAVSRLIQRTGINDYWLLSEKKHLVAETIHFVPKLLAISYIMSNPRYFGIEPLWHDDPEWTRVKVGRMVDLELLATEAGIDKRELKSANRELLHNVTPPDPTYHLKVRAAHVQAVAAVLERKDLNLIRYYFHTVASGDTLSEIAQYYSVTVDNILNINPGVQARYLKIGSRLLIPAYKDVLPYYGIKRNTGAAQTSGIHLVKRGETLWSIAKVYQTTPESLARINNMELNDVLREGRQLKLR